MIPRIKHLPTLLFVLLFWMAAQPCLGQWGNNRKSILTIPEKYILPVDQIDLTAVRKKDKVAGKSWFVYADRPNVFGTNSPGSGSQIGKLSFGESYAVVDEEGLYVHLYRDPRPDAKGYLSTQAKDFGWVHKQDLLLWEHCLVTASEGRLSRKAMLLNTLQSQPDAASISSGRVPFYIDPQRALPSGRSSGLFQIFFVFKFDHTNQAALLGKSELFSRGGQNNIVGWVSLDRLVMWDQRVAMEPNWDPNAVAERKDKGHPTAFLVSPNDALQYQKQGTAPKERIIWDADPQGKRRIGEYRRFPVLKGRISDNVIEAGVMGGVFSSAGQTRGSLNHLQAKAEDIVGKALKERSNIDFVFVVDGTKSMENFFLSDCRGNQ